jgi:hypothetical protein
VGTYTSQYPAHGVTPWDGILQGILDAIDVRLLALEAVTTIAGTKIATDSALLTTNTTVAVGQRSRFDTTSGNLTATLPVTPVDQAKVAIRHQVQGGSNVVNVAAGGTAKFNSATGPTSVALVMLNEEHEFTYNAATNLWWQKVSVTVPQADLRYAPFGASYKAQLYASTKVVQTGMDLVPNGMPIVAPVTLTAVQITLEFPTIGGTQVWNVVLDRGGVQSVITAVTVASGARSAVVNSLSTSLLSTDLILFQCTAANGATFTGSGPTWRLNFGGSLTVPTAPSINTGLTATPGATSVTLNWTAGAGAFNHLIRRDGVPYAITGSTAFVDSGPTGSGLSPGETHTYQVDSLVPGNITLYGTGVVSGPGASYAYFPAVAQALSALSSDWTVTLGTNAGTAAAIDSVGLLKFTSGAIGTNAVQDRVNAQWIKDGSNHSAYTLQTYFGFGVAGSFGDIYFNTPAFVSLATSAANFLQIQYSPSGYRWGIKAAGFNSGAFYVMTDTSTSPVQATATQAGGSVSWPITVTPNASGTNLYGLKIVLGAIQADGTQAISMYMGTTAQLDNGTLPLINTITVTSAQRNVSTGLHIGGLWLDQLGNQSATASAETMFYKNMTISATSPAGT